MITTKQPDHPVHPHHSPPPPPPNILVITCDQFRFPRFTYGPEGGFLPALKDIVGFQPTDDSNPFIRFFPGLCALRKNAAVLRNHTIATSACIPSRAAIMTGQYGTRTGVTQTDGLFKNGDAAAFPWLIADGIPTIGHWFQKAGYTTHYFGKWHVSNPPDHSLRRFGFDDWELSWPEPHGSLVNNLGAYRDHGFADLVCAFLRRMALGIPYARATAQADWSAPLKPNPPEETTPWIAFSSFTNPHDIATYPALLRGLYPGAPKVGPLEVPPRDTQSSAAKAGTMTFPLNPQDFPQHCAHLPPHDNLRNKPSCQFDYSYKMGLGLAAKTGLSVGQAKGIDPVLATLEAGIPFQLTHDPPDASVKFIQYYAWLMHLVDGHISRVLRALDEYGLHENTIVLFYSDHGEYGAAHGSMMEKWHSAYQEALHVPFVVQLPSSMSPSPELRQIDALSSHVDILPTLLGLAGLKDHDVDRIRTELRLHRIVPPFVGTNLKPLIMGETNEIIEADGHKREGVLFVTDDEITAPFPPDGDPHQLHSTKQYEVFCGAVEKLRSGEAPHGKAVPRLAPGSVRQPNHVRCVRTMKWKLARYWDPTGTHADEWEMYFLEEDPNELTNLLVMDKPFPTVIADLPELRRKEIENEAKKLGALLERYEKERLSPWPSNA